MQETRVLELGKPIERELKGGEVHTYQITLTTGQYLHVVVDQRGIDVVVTIFGPDGKQLTEVDSPNGAQGPEPVSHVTETAGRYRLLVQSLDSTATMGRYEAVIKELRAATSDDRRLIAAEKLSGEAGKFLAVGTAEALQQAITKYEEALPLWRSLGDIARESDALFNLGAARDMLGESRKALSYFSQALPLKRAIGDSFMAAVSMTNIAKCYYDLGEPNKALDYFEQALLRIQFADDRRLEAALHNNIGLVHNSLGENQKALDYFAKALLLRRAAKDRRGEAITISNIGLVYTVLEENEKALGYFEQALAIARQMGDRYGEGTTLSNIGRLHRDLGNPQKALDCLSQALELRHLVKDVRGEVSTVLNLGLVYLDLGDRQRALDHFKRALELSRASEDRTGEIYSLNHLGEVYRLQNEKEKALEAYHQGLKLSRELVDDRRAEAHALFRIARLESDRNDLSLAREHIESALAIVEAMRTKVASPESRTSYLASKQEYYEFYIDLLMREHRTHPLAGNDALALQTSERAHGRSLLETLAETSAGIRQNVDSTLLEEERLLQNLLNGKAGQLTRLLDRKPSEKQAAVARKELDSLLIQYQAVRNRILATSPRYAALTQPQPLNVKEIQQQVLDNETMLLEYALGRERSFLWAVTPTSVNSFELPKRAMIDSLARRLYVLLSSRNQRVANETPKRKRERVLLADAEYSKTAAALSQIILAPVARQLETKRVLVVAEGALQYISFGALPVPVASDQSSVISKQGKMNTDYRPLALDHEIVSLPSASVLAVLRRELAGRQAAPKTVAVLADPVFMSADPRVKRNQMGAEKKSGEPIASLENSRLVEGELERTARDFELGDTAGLHIPRLPFSRQEAEGIVSKLPTTECMKALGFAANHATATSKELSQYRIVHYATHGLLNSMHPELSGIVLSLVNENGEAQDGFLRLHEIYNLNLPADLVVLSACQTALGKEVKGEGLIGLTRGFMYAGAARVVASLWKVDDEATAELMKRFYQKMLGPEKLRSAAALRAAQIAMWQEKRWQSPYFWAAFVLQGEWK